METPSGTPKRDPFDELQARIESALDEIRPKVKRVFEELDRKVDDALNDMKPRLDEKMHAAQPRVDRFVAEVQPRVDALIQKMQTALEDMRRDFEDRAARGSGGADPRPAAGGPDLSDDVPPTEPAPEGPRSPADPPHL